MFLVRWHPRSKVIFVAAGEHAGRAGRRAIGTSDLLLMLIERDAGFAGSLLRAHSVGKSAIRDHLGAADASQGGPKAAIQRRRLDDDMKSAVLGALLAQRRAGDKRVQPEHLLLGLLASPAPEVMEILGRFQVSEVELSVELERYLGIRD